MLWNLIAMQNYYLIGKGHELENIHRLLHNDKIIGC